MSDKVRREVWITYEVTDSACWCWMDALCPHGWTWRNDEHTHSDAITDDAHESLADAVRSLFSIRGAESIGRLVRRRYSPVYRHATMTVFVLPPESRAMTLTCDHGGTGDWPSATWAIERKEITPRSRVGDGFRSDADAYRPKTDASPSRP